MTKICTKCEQEKELSEFYLRQSACKDCIKIKYNDYYKNNISKCKNRMKQWRINNKEYKKEYDKNYRKTHKEEITSKNKERWKHNKHKMIMCKLKCLQNPKSKRKAEKYIKKYMYKKYHSDINFKMKSILRARINCALKGVHKSNSSEKLLGCTINQLKHHIEKQFQIGMTWKNHGAWHIDHIIPCAYFDLTNSNQQKLCFHYTNLQPLWAADNISKSNKIIQ